MQKFDSKRRRLNAASQKTTNSSNSNRWLGWEHVEQMPCLGHTRNFHCMLQIKLACFSTRCQLGCDSVACINVACSMQRKNDLDIVSVQVSKSMSPSCLDKVPRGAPHSAKPRTDIKLIQPAGDQSTATKFAMSQWGVIQINKGSMLTVL